MLCCFFRAFSSPTPKEGRVRQGQVGLGGRGIRNRVCFGLAQFHHVRWDMRILVPHPPQSFVERDPTFNLGSR